MHSTAFHCQEETKAITLVQSRFRSISQRNWYCSTRVLRHASATCIQSLWRRAVSQQKHRALLRRREAACSLLVRWWSDQWYRYRRNEAAISLQRMQRGRCERKVPLLVEHSQFWLPHDPSGCYQRGKLHAVRIGHLLCSSECDAIISLANRHAAAHGWSTMRHHNYPTKDIEVESSNAPELHKVIWPIVSQRVLPTLATRYDFEERELVVRDMFVARYEGGHEREGVQKDLKMHRDGSLLSFSILLSDPRDFEGGGLRFRSIRPFCESAGHHVLPHVGRGDITMHCGKLWHEVPTVVTGQRYVLVGFVTLRSLLLFELSLRRIAYAVDRADLLQNDSFSIGGFTKILKHLWFKSSHDSIRGTNASQPRLDEGAVLKPDDSGCEAPPPDVCVLHLSRRVDRQPSVAAICAHAERASLRPLVIEAVDGRKLGPREVAPFLDLTPSSAFLSRSIMRPGEVGCFMSHRRAWERLRKRGGYVVEDDAILSLDCFERFAHAIAATPPCRVVFGRFSYPAGYSGKSLPPMAPIADGVGELTCPCYNTNMYYIDAAAADALLDASSQPHLAAPCDDFLSIGAGLHPTTRGTLFRAFALQPEALFVAPSNGDTGSNSDSHTDELSEVDMKLAVDDDWAEVWWAEKFYTLVQTTIRDSASRRQKATPSSLSKTLALDVLRYVSSPQSPPHS